MRLVKLATPEGPRVCADHDGELRPLEPAEAQRFSVLGGQAGAPPPGAGLLAPVAPRKIIAIGLNYLDHIREANMEPPKAPLVFTKFTSSLAGPGDTVVIDQELA